MMRIDQYLIDASRGEARFKIKEMLSESGAYQIALAVDTAMDDKLVCVKTINYDVARTEEKKYVGLRRKDLHDELKFLSEPCHLLPEPLDWIQIQESQTVIEREPVLVYEYMHGETLFDLVQGRYAKGMNPNRALRFIKEIAIFLQTIHKSAYVFRDLDPRHIIVGFDDILHVVGCGNAIKIGDKFNPEKTPTNPVYTAPEIRDERSGKLIKPACDVYALGALFTFLLTGIEPKSNTESPLTHAAYDRLKNLDEGYQLLVVRCMAPLAKNRFGAIARLLPFLQKTSLPQRSDKDFGMLDLPKPWTGNDPENRAASSSLSAGPLVSVDKEREAFIKSKLEKDDDAIIPKRDVPKRDAILPKEESKEVANRPNSFPSWLIFLAIILVLGAAGLVVMFAL